tara:strand:+ start:340 stop:513 length:174 start_codon:yes stop_codon:yes gene_type:complete
MATSEYQKFIIKAIREGRIKKKFRDKPIQHSNRKQNDLSVTKTFMNRKKVNRPNGRK